MAIYEYGEAHCGFIPDPNTTSVYRGRPVLVPREHILKYLADANTRLNDLRTLGVNGLDIIQHCFPRPSSTQGHSKENTEGVRLRIRLLLAVVLYLDVHSDKQDSVCTS